ncbi:hypothetical protein [Polaromonas sp.]|uniref:hypothetical protein n=1 Tax=Polaromonas sp. TaxID=1869339 RepID=UPI00326574F9
MRAFFFALLISIACSTVAGCAEAKTWREGSRKKARQAPGSRRCSMQRVNARAEPEPGKKKERRKEGKRRAQISARKPARR